jgi:antirestriction protein
MRIYVACLASYNAGTLYGRWIDATSDVDAMGAEIAEMLRGSRYPNVMVTHPETGEQVPSAEEYAIHDYDGVPSSFGEYPGLQAIADFVELCESHEYIDSDDMAAIVADFHKVDDARDALTNDFCGIYDSFRDYADEIADEMMACHDGEIPQMLVNYFDYEAHACDLALSMTTVEVSNGVAVFYS